MNDCRFPLLSLLVSAPLLGQNPLQALRVPGPVRDAGTYHVTTGTWTRGGRGAAVGPDVIYRNDAPSGYFGTGWEGCWTMDEVMLPGPTSPLGGLQDAYAIDGFEFAYCTNGPTTIDWTFGFWNSYVPCDNPASPLSCLDEIPVGFVLAGLPGGAACWTVTVDLSGGSEFCFEADGGVCSPGYDGGGLWLDHGAIGFGWVTSAGVIAGPVMAGDPSWIPMGDGTCYRPGYSNSCGLMIGTGLGTEDLMSISNYDFGGAGVFASCTLGNGCYFFNYTNNNGCGTTSSTPITQYHFTLYTDCTVPATCRFPIAYCDESQNPNNAADIAIDTYDSTAASIHVSLSSGPPNQFCYLLVGNDSMTLSQPPGSKGDLCVIGGNCLGRFDKDIGRISAGGAFDTDIKNALSSPCQGAFQVTPGSTWAFQYWHRQPMGQPSTFSSALLVSFN